uniref:Uncharacterized protein n=1 Tax=Timspurckia oligopyrenoides TaxID=708627 RepID=A0A7S0ZDT9_9RHOD|mmetsp:Transcript_1396/g.2535  ORF Transcript_1396/g.2535 Transcript_1396/m.2535 type:complete len:281 (+) Transcript_1396:97-939(+)
MQQHFGEEMKLSPHRIRINVFDGPSSKEEKDLFRERILKSWKLRYDNEQALLKRQRMSGDCSVRCNQTCGNVACRSSGENERVDFVNDEELQINVFQCELEALKKKRSALLQKLEKLKAIREQKKVELGHSDDARIGENNRKKESVAPENSRRIQADATQLNEQLKMGNVESRHQQFPNAGVEQGEQQLQAQQGVVQENGLDSNASRKRRFSPVENVDLDALKKHAAARNSVLDTNGSNTSLRFPENDTCGAGHTEAMKNASDLRLQVSDAQVTLGHQAN